MAKRIAGARTTISVPGDLKRRMLKVRHVNWSAIAAAAFEAELAAIAQRSQGVDIHSVRERLRASKAASETESYRKGFEEGYRWAQTSAEHAELKRLSTMYNSLAGRSPDFDSHFNRFGSVREGKQRNAAGWLARIILGDEVGADSWSELLWEPAFGEVAAARAIKDLDRLRGFAHGAIRLFEEAAV